MKNEGNMNKKENKEHQRNPNDDEEDMTDNGNDHHG